MTMVLAGLLAVGCGGMKGNEGEEVQAIDTSVALPGRVGEVSLSIPNGAQECAARARRPQARPWP